jgi:hypothetical protein
MSTINRQEITEALERLGQLAERRGVDLWETLYGYD